MVDMEWVDPPPHVEPPSRVDLVAAELRRNPHRWARIESGATTFFSWWGVLQSNPDYEVKVVKQGDAANLIRPRDVYARYVGKP